MATTASPIALRRLLTRLDQTLYAPDLDPQLRTCQYERNRVGANIEYARTLLLTLEKQTAAGRATQSQQQQAQSHLQRERDWIKRLNAKLRELNAAAHAEEDSEDDGDADQEENILSTYAPARNDTEAGLESGEGSGSTNPGGGGGAATASHTPRAIASPIPNEIRPRGPQSTLNASDPGAAASSSAREQLFSRRTKPPARDGALPATETLMSHNRTEQESLTTGLLGLAQALKESSLQFGTSLESEKDVLRNAEKGLDRNAEGMDAAAAKMGTLRKMSEGQGWWGRIKLYGMIGALWVALFLVVFVGPKIRF